MRLSTLRASRSAVTEKRGADRAPPAVRGEVKVWELLQRAQFVNADSFDLSDALRDRIKPRRVARIGANLAVTDGAFTIDHADGTPAAAF